MDWNTVIQFVSPLAVAGLIIAVLKAAHDRITQIRQAVLSILPHVRIDRVSTASPPYSLEIVLLNAGMGPAMNLSITLDGLPGWEHVRPRLEAHQVMTASTVIPDDAPIRVQPENATLTVSYQDQFGGEDKLVCPIVQSPRADGLFNVAANLQQIREVRYHFTDWRLWKLRDQVP